MDVVAVVVATGGEPRRRRRYSSGVTAPRSPSAAVSRWPFAAAIEQGVDVSGIARRRKRCRVAHDSAGSSVLQSHRRCSSRSESRTRLNFSNRPTRSSALRVKSERLRLLQVRKRSSDPPTAARAQSRRLALQAAGTARISSTFTCDDK